MPKAVALMSTGLDSLLSAKIVRDRGVEVVGLHCTFEFGFVPGPSREETLKRLIEPMGISLRTLDITEPYMEVMRKPAHGFGSAVNPCIDCHLFMLRRARELMSEIGADFVVTGEVVGQRPMSQNRPMLFHIEKLADLRGLILRPLSARSLPVTLPEEKGWVDRGTLYGITGRGRKVQEALASEFGITRYFQPAGGCILTDPFYAKRIKAFIRHRGQEALTSEVMNLCRHGRHFWLDGGQWIIVGREEEDNEAIARLAGGRWLFEAADLEGPTAVADGLADDEDFLGAASMLVRYVNKRKEEEIRVRYRKDGTERMVSARAAEASVMDEWKV
jgi:tRNA-uridine 2-sulfurtransferase